MYIEVANSVFFCGTDLVWFPDNDHLWIETCRNIQCDSIISISKKQANLSIGFMQKCRLIQKSKCKKKQKLTILAKPRNI